MAVIAVKADAPVIPPFSTHIHIFEDLGIWKTM